VDNSVRAELPGGRGDPVVHNEALHQREHSTGLRYLSLMDMVSRRWLLGAVGTSSALSLTVGDRHVAAAFAPREVEALAPTAGMSLNVLIDASGDAFPPIPAKSLILGAELFLGASTVSNFVTVEMLFQGLATGLSSGHDFSVTAESGGSTGPFPFSGPNFSPVVADDGYIRLHVVQGAQHVRGVRIYYVPAVAAAAGGFQAGPVARVVDTRVNLGGPMIQPNEERRVGLPTASGARAAVFNLTVTDTVGGGYLAAFPAGTAYQSTSSVNWSSTGSTIAALVISGVDSSGAVTIRGGVNPTNFLVDFVGSLI
jgi:hypothetical protein